MEDNSLTQEDSQIAIDNLQQANKLIRSRAIVLTFFLVLMMAFSLSIDQNRIEENNLNRAYDQLTRLMRPDSMQKILKRDSVQFFYKAGLGPYMSLEVLYAKLKKDSFQNTEPVNNAIDQVDELIRNKKKENMSTAVSVVGFSLPIKPIMLLAPIILLLLYHDFSVTMLYRNNLEGKIMKLKIPTWRVGPEFIGLQMFDFIPHKFRYIKGLWSFIQIIVLFLPTIPAFYFALYAKDNESAGWLVTITNLLCCVIIVADFLMLVDTENLLGIRNISMLFTGQAEANKSSSFFLRTRLRLLIILPLFIGVFTFFAFYSFGERSNPIICSAVAFSQALLLSLFNWLRPKVKNRFWGGYIRMFAGGAFFVSFYWFIIALLTCLGAIKFRALSSDDFITTSYLLFAFGFFFKMVYLIYTDKNEKPALNEKEIEQKTDEVQV